MKVSISSSTFADFLDRILEGDKAGCRRLVTQLQDDQVPAIDLYVDLFSRALYEIGRRWESGLLSVAAEHMATAIVEDLLAQVFARLPRHKLVRKRAIVFCGADELHQVGGRMVADTLEFLGWDVAFLGANTPTADLLELVKTWKPDLVALSLTLETNLEKGLGALRALRANHPKLRLLAGGQAVKRNESRLGDIQDLTILSSLHGLVESFAV